jgi:hypothetical protein
MESFKGSSGRIEINDANPILIEKGLRVSLNWQLLRNRPWSRQSVRAYTVPVDNIYTSAHHCLPKSWNPGVITVERKYHYTTKKCQGTYSCL